MIIHPWRACEIELMAARTYPNPYTDVEVWAEFRHESGQTIRRPAFWDGEQIWRRRIVIQYFVNHDLRSSHAHMRIWHTCTCAARAGI